MKLTIQLYNQGMSNIFCVIRQVEQFSNTDYSWKILVKEGYDLIHQYQYSKTIESNERRWM